MTAAASSSASAVRVRGLHRRFGSRTVLDHLDLEIAAGEFVALIGKSGCGKTTLLRSLAGIDPIDQGTIATPHRRSVVFQEPRLLPWWRVVRNVGVGLSGSDANRRAEAALDEVGLGARRDAWPATLSGGEAQRVALARALVRAPELLLLDEPFASLDALTRIKMHALVRALAERHRPAVLLVTHDVDEAIVLADRVLVMREGRIAVEHRTPAGARDRRTSVFGELRAKLLAELDVPTD